MKFKTKDIIVQYSGKYKNSFHAKCVDLGVTDVQGIQRGKGMLWFCISCIKDIEDLWNWKEEISALNQKLDSEIGELKKLINGMNKHSIEYNKLEKQVERYADVSGEVVVIRPKNIEQNSKQTLETVQKYINPLTLEVSIKGIRNVKDG